MKTSWLVFGIFGGLTISLPAQTARESIGAASGGNYYPNSISPEQRQQFLEGAEKIQKKQIYDLVHGQVYRVVNEQTYNILKNSSWQIIGGNLYGKNDGVVILEKLENKYIALTNYVGSEVEHQNILTVALRVGNYDDGGRPIEFWDCGTSPTEEQMNQIKDDEVKAQALIDKQKADELKASQVRNYATQSKTMIWLQSQATNGSISSQCSLGLHYLNGLGCETNKELAIYWLKSAADQGDAEASNKLVTLRP